MTNFVMLIGPGRYRLTRQMLETLEANTDMSKINMTFVCDFDEFRLNALVDNFLQRHDNATALFAVKSGHTLSQLKNLGVAWSEQRWGRGNWLYISDSDVAFLPGWLSKLIMIAENGEPLYFRLWGGQIHPFHQPIKPVEDHARFGYTEHGILDGPSWMMRWDTWDNCGPLDRTTAPGVCQSEEYGFCERLRGPIRPSGDFFTNPIDSAKQYGGGRIGVIHPHVVIHTGLTHLDGHDCVGRKEREAMIPKGILAE